MENPQEQLQIASLEKYSNQSQTTQNSDNFITIYKGELTKEGVAKGIERIIKAFPKFDKNQLEVLKDRIKENGFTDQRFMDAINHVIDNYEGWDKLPNLANFIKFDRIKGVYSYAEVLKMRENGVPMNRFECFDKEKQLWTEKIIELK